MWDILCLPVGHLRRGDMGCRLCNHTLFSFGLARLLKSDPENSGEPADIIKQQQHRQGAPSCALVLHTGPIKIDGLTGLLFFSLSRNMPRVWWCDPRNSDFAKFLPVNTPPANPLYSPQVVCLVSHQECICMGVNSPPDFACRYVMVRLYILCYEYNNNPQFGEHPMHWELGTCTRSMYQSMDLWRCSVVCTQNRQDQQRQQ